MLSEFATPSGPMSLLARFIVWALYAAFGLMTGLQVRWLPDYSAALSGGGFLLSERRHWLGGLVVSELWKPRLLQVSNHPASAPSV